MDRLRVLAEARGFFTRAGAFSQGHDDKTIRRALRARLWVRVRPGSYTFPDLWAPLDEASRHRVTGHSVAQRLGSNVALSHVSAVLDHELDFWGLDLSRVHVTRLDGGAGRTEAGVQHHEGMCLDEDLMDQHGHAVVRPVRAALEAGALAGPEPGLVALDSALRKGGPAARDELERTFALMQSWPLVRPLQIVTRLADGRAESAGESRSRWLFYCQGVPMPELQYPVLDGSGRLVGVSDFAWPEHRLLGEFDGRVKYGRLLRPGQEPGDAVFEEKKREDLLRELTGWQMVRLVWADLQHPAATAARVRRMLRLRAA
jgi:hypothetical protein